MNYFIIIDERYFLQQIHLKHSVGNRPFRRKNIIPEIIDLWKKKIRICL